MSIFKKEYDIQVDPRLQRAFKEMLITVGVFVFYCLFSLAVAWNVGMSTTPENYKYVLGFPQWVFWTLVAGPVLFLGVVSYITLFVFKDDSLDPWIDEEIDEERMVE